MKKIVIYIVSILMISACSSLKVAVDFDKDIDFNSYKTIHFFGWESDSDELMNRFDIQRIENGFQEEFERRGFTFVENYDADIIVSLFAASEMKTQRTATTSHFGGGYYWGGIGASTTSMNEYDYEVGTLVVSVFDAKEKILIWQGIANDAIKESTNMREYQTKYAVSNVMKKFPVKPV